MLVTINHNGFHGWTTVRLRLKGEPGDLVRLSRHQARELRTAACGVSDCKCGEDLGDACPDWLDYANYRDDDHLPHIRIPLEGASIDLVGNYPQRS